MKFKKDFNCQVCLEVAVSAGYPNNGLYKLYIRKCKCELELGRYSISPVLPKTVVGVYINTKKTTFLQILKLRVVFIVLILFTTMTVL